MCCDGKEHIIFIGGVRCGKSERSRKMLGMSHEEYKKHIESIESLLEKEKARRESAEMIFQMFLEREM